jgi:hemerythrin-like domain-containing protein
MSPCNITIRPQSQHLINRKKLLSSPIENEGDFMNDQIDLYANIHKGQRSRFFKIAMQAGIIDYADQNFLDRLYDELNSFREHMRFHATAEEKYIHPMLSERVPGGARKLEEDHRIINQRFDDLVTHLDATRAQSADLRKRRELTLEFYRAWNRFLSFYFLHINKEEEQVTPVLWKLCTNEELAATFKMIMASQKPDELRENFEMMLPAINLYERVEMIKAGQASMPPEAFQGFLKLTEHVLSPDDWTALKSKLGIK